MLSFASLEVEQRDKRRRATESNRKRCRRKNQKNSDNDDDNDDDNAAAAAAAAGTDHAINGKSKFTRPSSSSTATNSVSPLFNLIPLEFAIQQDLIQAQQKFLGMLVVSSSSAFSCTTTTTSTTNNDNCTTPKMGFAFDCFRQVAKETQLAALHRFVPPRCDDASFSQLLYASCLDLLSSRQQQQRKQPLQQQQQPQQDAFAIFALYLLHQTNPLPVAPSSSSLLSSFPTGLTKPENPKFMFYRRNYRPLIRVDPAIYTRLLQLRQWPNLNGDDDEHVSGTSTMMSVLASDVACVLDRLWPHFLLASYVGPMGLHGLAQRQQLHAALSDDTAADWNNQSYAVSVPNIHSESEPQNNSGQNPSEDDDELRQRIKSYLDCRRALRLPPPNTGQRNERIRRAMQPMASSSRHNITTWEERLENCIAVGRGQVDNHHGGASLIITTTTLKLPARVVTFALSSATANSQIMGGDDDNDETNNNNKDPSREIQMKNMGTSDEATNKQGQEDEPTNFKCAALDHNTEEFTLILPSGISAVMQKSLESAIQTLVYRPGGSNLFGPRAGDGPPQDMDHEDSGEMSTIGSRGAASAATASIGTISAVGRGALVALIQAAAAAAAKPNDSASTTDSAGTVSAVGRGALVALIQAAAATAPQALASPASLPEKTGPSSFLDNADSSEDDNDEKNGHWKKPRPHQRQRQRRQNPKKPPALPMDDVISDVSSDEEATKVSVTGGSTVGRRALEDLLTEASRTTASQRAKAKRQPAAKAKQTKRAAASNANTNTSSIRRQPTRATRTKKKPASPLLQEESCEESEAASDDSDDGEVATDDYSNSRSETGSRQGQAALQALLAKVLK